MNEYNYKSVQDLIIKAALYDGISTTIGPDQFIEASDVLRVTFSRDNNYTSTLIELSDKHRNPEETALYCCKRALYDLLCYPYEKIEYKKEKEN
jgi:hypothetical protein